MTKKNGTKSNRHRKMLAASFSVMLIISFTVIAVAKFYKEENVKTVLSGDNIASYHLELVGTGKETTLTQELLLADLNPGDIRTVEFFVTNGNEEKKLYSDVSMDYTIQIVHTSNIPLIYELYNGAGKKINPVSVTETGEKYNNTGVYINYENDNSGKLFTLKTASDDSDKVSSHKYTLKIIWPKNDESADFKYVKEIDFLSININAYEHNPLKNN
ncbi:MAG: hypothetical protein HFI34_04530 [Lachnospiraceae bacterium]|nr:hypothetical protein [Lachnospiraceae bacterium]